MKYVWLLLGPLLGACSVDGVSAEPVQAPFTVSDYYVPSGYMGDSALTDRSPRPMSLRYDACLPRPAGAHGDCYRFDYTPVPVPEGGKGWGGVYWQSPANNWGQDDPQRVRPNARKVSFLTAGKAGGESATFMAAGLSQATDPEGAPLPHGDSFGETLVVTLTPELTRYEIPLPEGQVYDHVTGGFGFSLTALGPDPQTLFLDDLRWLP